MNKGLPLIRLAALAMCNIAFATGAMAADKAAPPSKVDSVTDSYGDVKVTDPYRWLENAADPKVHEWSLAQDARTRQYFDKLPFRNPMFDRLMTQISASSSSFYNLQAVGDKVFAYYNLPPKQQPMIAILDNSADPTSAKVVIDPNAINTQGTTAIDWFVPSPQGNLVAASMSDNGSEDGSLHIFDVATGKEVDKVIPRVQYPTGGGSMAWRADGSGFWYTRYPGPDEAADRQHFYQQVYYHKIGDDPAKDAYVIGKDFPKVAEIALDNKQNHDYTVITVANGDGGEYAHYVLGPDGSIKQITHFEDKIVAAAIGADDAVYMISHDGAPHGKLTKLPLNDLDLHHAKTIVAQSDAVMQGGGEFGGTPIVITKNAIYLRELIGGPSRVAIFDHEGKAKGDLPLPDVASVDEVEPLSDGSVLYAVRTFLKPPYYARFDEAGGKASDTKLAQTSPVNFDDTEVERVFATSKDGTKVPLNIVHRKGVKLDGSNPVLLYGYGGYGVNMVPHFLGAPTRLWLDAGGIYVVANLRGGGEYGEEWHAQGALTHKQNVFDDFAAAAKYLIAQKYTSKEHLAIMGGSNGGLLMGAEFTQHPELFRAVVSQVGIYDMLRVELDPNGAFNTTEFGSVKNPDQFKALMAYSPYHHVAKGTKYPAIFMATGETDGRVNPMHSRKMIARLQASTASNHPVLLSINSHAGHGIGSSLTIKVNQAADTYAFLFDQLGMKFPGPVATAAK
jgi:prolyl oligopeptidase